MKQQIAIYPLGMNKTSNEELSLDHTKAKRTKGFKSTILRQLISNAEIYSTPKMVIPTINTESQFLKLIFFKLQVLNTLCVWVFFFSEGGSA